MDSATLQNILYAVAMVLATAFLRVWSSLQSGKAKDSAHASALDAMERKARIVVEEVEQTERKSAGAMTADLAERLRKTALLKLQEVARVEFGQLLDAGYDKDAIATLQRALIESAVGRLDKK